MKINKIVLLITVPIFFYVLFYSYNPSPIQHKLMPKKDSVPLHFSKELIAYHFDYPVGKPNGKGYYNAQAFGKNHHLGDDWNGVGGGNTDLGDTIYAIANGYVTTAKDFKGGWGNVVRIIHQLPNTTSVESIYAHADKLLVKENTWVNKGMPIATIGTAHGVYLAHLHLEIRTQIHKSLGFGYGTVTTDYTNPTAFIKAHR